MRPHVIGCYQCPFHNKCNEFGKYGYYEPILRDPKFKEKFISNIVKEVRDCNSKKFGVGN